MAPIWLVLLLSTCHVVVESVMNYCEVDHFHFSNDSDILHFTKENTEFEFTQVGRFKSLHCCTKGYRSIEWYKDGVPYPWSSDYSSFIIYPESTNQTIYTQLTSEGDSGRYWCLVRNDTYAFKHEVKLLVTGPSSAVGPPKTTYKPRDQYVRVGEAARLYCEAFVGRINVPDARSDIIWYRPGINDSLQDDNRVYQKVVVRDEKQIVGNLLFIEQVTPDDFGPYICRVSNTIDQILELPASLVERQLQFPESTSQRKSTWMAFVILTIAILFLISFFIFIIKFGLHLRLLLKRCRAPLTEGDCKDNDVVIVFHEADTDFTIGRIVPTLQYRYHYLCSVVSVKSNMESVESRLIQRAKISKRLLVIVTKSLIKEWNCKSISNVISSLLTMHPKIICVFTQALPQLDLKTEEGRELKDLLNKVHYILFSEREIRQFWALLRLGLPVRRKPISRQRLSSRESLEDLV